MIRESQVIEAKNVEIAKQIFLDEVDEKFNDNVEEGGDDSLFYVNTNVENCEFIDVVDETNITAYLPSTMVLKLASL